MPTPDSSPGPFEPIKLTDTPDAPKIMIDIDHYGDGSAHQKGATYAVDIQNFPGARQALVIHQYSSIREAFRLDNTDSNAGIYLNNTQNKHINPGRTGEGSAFLKFRPFHVDDFVHYAYLLDDLTFKNDTAKTWSFQATRDDAAVLAFKDADGQVVASVDQAGRIRSEQLAALDAASRDSGWRDLTSLVVDAGHIVSSGSLLVRRRGVDVELRADGLSLTQSLRGAVVLATLPAGFVPEHTAVDTTTAWDLGDAAVAWRASRDGAVETRSLRAGKKITGSLRFTTADAWPTSSP